MKLEDLQNKIITFTPEVDNWEIDFDAGMKARVISTGSANDDCDFILVDFSEFEESNKKFGQANYYNNQHEPCLFWWETKGYPANKRKRIHLDLSPETWPFGVEPAPEVDTEAAAVKNAMAELRAATKKQILSWGAPSTYKSNSYPKGFLDALSWTLEETDKYIELNETKK